MIYFSHRCSPPLVLKAALLLTLAAGVVPGASAQTDENPDMSPPAVSNPPSQVQQTAPPPEPPPASVEPEPTPPGAVGPTSAEPQVTAFDITVRAPDAVRELLEKHLELQRYRAVTDLESAELARLMVLAESNARNLLATMGYFSPDIRITREGGVNERPNIVVAVEPGPTTTIGAVNLTFGGDIAQSSDADAMAQRFQITRDWRLPAGQRFTQDGWSGAKTQALRELVARRYPAGKLGGSLADVDAESNSAKLSVNLDSGPLYRLGPLEVTGIERYDPVLVPRLARLKQGAVYDQKELVQAQQRLSSSGYFDSAYVFINPENDPLAVPVQIQVREAKLQKVILGVGVTSDSGPRASVEYTHHRVPGIGWNAATKLQIEKKAPFAQTEWTAIPDEKNWRLSALGRFERLDDGALITQAQRLRFGKLQLGDTIDRNVFVQYDRANIQGPGTVGNTPASVGDGSALTANFFWTGRYFDSVPFPNRGYAISAELGAGTTLTGEHRPFTRTVMRWMGIKPLEGSRIALRAEGGAVLAKDGARIPGTQLFRTGGDTTVRGYAYRDIGIALQNGVIGPGRYLAVGSVEWQRPLILKGRPSEFENTLFIDAGAVANKLNDLRASVGIGTGLRWRSPIGPVAIDLAYGLKVRRARLHISLGFAF